MRRIRFCEICREYTMEEKCPRCGSSTILKKSIFKIDDKFFEYRMKAKIEELKERGLYG